MDQAPGWRTDPDNEAEERYWDGSAWTDRVRPAGKAIVLHLPEHVPELQRALAAATADIDAVEDRLSTLFDRTDATGTNGTNGSNGTSGTNGTHRTGPVAGPGRNGSRPSANHQPVDDFDVELYLDFEVDESEGFTLNGKGDMAGTSHLNGFAGADEGFADLDAALAAEEPEHDIEAAASAPMPAPKKGLFRRRT
jgi:hypothetical protein